jgi:hypothetical protein
MQRHARRLLQTGAENTFLKRVRVQPDSPVRPDKGLSSAKDPGGRRIQAPARLHTRFAHIFDRMDRMPGFADSLSVEPHRHRSKTESRPILEILFILSSVCRRHGAGLCPPIANVLVVTHSDARGGNAESGGIPRDFRAVDNRCGADCFVVAFGSATLSKPVTGIRGASPAFVQRAAGT